jgi:predicted ribosome quality control (RQC) complex YloA/Tae2 family protein
MFCPSHIAYECEYDNTADMMFYFRIEDGNMISVLDARNRIISSLEHFNFNYRDITGGQASFYTEGKTFKQFKKIVQLMVKLDGFNVIEIKHCLYPELGLY